MAVFSANHLAPTFAVYSPSAGTASNPTDSGFFLAPYNAQARSGYAWPTHPATQVNVAFTIGGGTHSLGTFLPAPYNSAYRSGHPWPTHVSNGRQNLRIQIYHRDAIPGETSKVTLKMEIANGADTFYGSSSSTVTKEQTTGSFGIGVPATPAILIGSSKWALQRDPMASTWDAFKSTGLPGGPINTYYDAQAARGGKDGRTLVVVSRQSGTAHHDSISFSKDDGVTWAKGVGVTADAHWQFVAWTGKHFIVTGQKDEAWNRSLYYLLSADGENWTRREFPSAFHSTGIAASGGMVVVPEYTQDNYTNRFYYHSADHGLTWKKITRSGYLSMAHIAAHHGVFVRRTQTSLYWTTASKLDDTATEWTNLLHGMDSSASLVPIKAGIAIFNTYGNGAFKIFDTTTRTLGPLKTGPNAWGTATNRKHLVQTWDALVMFMGGGQSTSKMFVSTDNGDTWVERTLPQTDQFFYTTAGEDELTYSNRSTDEQRTTMMMPQASGVSGAPEGTSSQPLLMEQASGTSFQTLPENGESYQTVTLEAASGSAESVLVESSATVPAITGSGTGLRGEVGSSAHTMSMFGVVSTGKVGDVGSSSLTLSMPTTTGTAQQYIVQSSVTLPMEQALGADLFIGESNQTLLMPTTTGTASQGTFISQITLAMELAGGAGYTESIGTSAQNVKQATGSGAGESKFNNGTSAQVIPLITGSSYALDGEIGSSIKTMPVLLTNGVGVNGTIGSSSKTVTAVVANSVGIPSIDGTSTVTVPVMIGTGAGYTEAVGYSVTVELPFIAHGRALRLTDEAKAETFVLQTEGMALSSYSNFTFNSFARFQGKTLGANSLGLYQLGGHTDDEEPINATIKTGVFDYGTDLAKRIEKMYVGYTATGDLVLHVKAGDAAYEYPLKKMDRNSLHTAQVQVGKGLKARYWQYELRNKDGADFEFDSIAVEPEVLKRRA